MVGLRVVHHDVRVGAGCQHALAGIQAVQLGGILRQHAAHGTQTDLLFGHSEGVDQLASRLHAGDTAGNGGEVVPPGQLLRRGEGAVVGGHGLHLAPADGAPQGVAVRLLADGGRADVLGRLKPVLVVVHAVVQQQILGARLHEHLLAAPAGVGDLVQRFDVGGVDDDHGDVHLLGDAQQASHGLGLHDVRPRLRMAVHAVLARGLLLRDQRVDDTGILAVYAADAALFLQLLQRLVHGLVADHHGRVGHVHLEGGDALGVHVVYLTFDRLVPVVDGHVEAVVTGALAVRLLVPQTQTVVERLALVGAGKVNDGGGAAVERGAGAAGEIIRRGGVAHVQIKVGVRVDKAGEQQHPGHIHYLRTDGRDVAADVQYLLALHQNIRPAGPLAGDNGTALEQQSHHKTSSFE